VKVARAAVARRLSLETYEEDEEETAEGEGPIQSS
jgi:hypothetical protein